MSRVYTARRVCWSCRCVFTIEGSAPKFCKNQDCIRQRRKADRLAQKQAEAARRPKVPEGSEAHLARALRSGE